MTCSYVRLITVRDLAESSLEYYAIAMEGDKYVEEGGESQGRVPATSGDGT